MPFMKFSYQLNDHMPPYAEAIVNGLLDVIQTLLNAGADINIAHSVSDVTEYAEKTSLHVVMYMYKMVLHSQLRVYIVHNCCILFITKDLQTYKNAYECSLHAITKLLDILRGSCTIFLLHEYIYR